MPRIRTVKPEIWDDEDFGVLTRDARLLFVGLITQADDFGRLRADARLLRAKIFPYDDDLTTTEIDHWLTELIDASLVVLYESHGKRYAYLTGWHNQKIDRPTESRLPDPDSGQKVDPRRGLAESSASPRESTAGDQGEDQGSGIKDQGVAADRADAPLSHLLADLIAQNGSRRPRVGRRWVDAERLMVTADERDPLEAERLIRWCQADEFWRSNVMSMAKFREQYDRLRLQAQRRGGQTKADRIEDNVRALQAFAQTEPVIEGRAEEVAS